MKNDDLTPAMKGSVRAIVREELTEYPTRGEMQQMLQKYATKEDLQAMVRKLNEGIDQVLTVVVNINDHLKGKVDNHERRIKKLENHTGLAVPA